MAALENLYTPLFAQANLLELRLYILYILHTSSMQLDQAAADFEASIEPVEKNTQTWNSSLAHCRL